MAKGKFVNPDYARQFCEDLPLLAEFAKRTGAHLVATAPSKENGRVENLYFFEDGLGGYTRKGILDTIVELNRLN